MNEPAAPQAILDHPRIDQWIASPMELDPGGIGADPRIVRVVCDGSFIGVVADTEMSALRAIGRMESLAKWTPGAPAPSDPIKAIKATSAKPEISHS